MDKRPAGLGALIYLALATVSDALFSQSWYRVAELKPRLRGHAQIHRHYYRSKTWYVLQDHSSGKFHRYSPEAYLIIQLMDGTRDMETVWQQACEQLGDDMPSQDEIINLLGQLHSSDLLQSDKMPDVADIHQRYLKQKRNKILQYVKSPMSMKLPLVDPNKFLDATYAWVAPLFSKPAQFLWLLLMVYALTQLGVHWESITQNWSDRVFDGKNFLLLGLVYPVIKLIHEFGHAYAVKRYGGEVHEMGVMFLVFIPIPYVDASASSALREKHQRMFIGAAGILVELTLAAMALLLWVNIEPGIVRALLFNVMLIGGISTILFNGNPLLRFDAYYVLSDAIEIPNLGNKSNQFFGHWIQRFILRIEETQIKTESRREALWLWFYCIASFCYRIFIMIGISLFVAQKFFFVGVILAIWSLFNTLVLPFMKLLKTLRTNALLLRYKAKVNAFIFATASILAAILFALPVPYKTITEGVLWASDESQMSLKADCFVNEVLVNYDQVVKQNDIILRCDPTELNTEIRVSEAKLNELKAKLRESLKENRVEYGVLKDEIRRTEEELAIVKEKFAGLELKAPVSGKANINGLNDLLGQFLARGQYIGYIDNKSTRRARVVVEQHNIETVKNNLTHIDLISAEALYESVAANISREFPEATEELPSLALSVNGGGNIVLNPERQTGEANALAPVFIVDINLSDETPLYNRVGERVYVRFHHQPEPLAYRIGRKIRRLFLKEFDV